MPLAFTPTSVPVTVDETKCIADKGCSVCVDVCPLDVLRISELTGNAYMKCLLGSICGRFDEVSAHPCGRCLVGSPAIPCFKLPL